MDCKYINNVYELEVSIDIDPFVPRLSQLRQWPPNLVVPFVDELQRWGFATLITLMLASIGDYRAALRSIS